MVERAVSYPDTDVLVVSENRLLRETLARVLRKKVGIGRAFACSFSADLMQQVARAQAHVLLLDAGRATGSMPQMVTEAKTLVPTLHVIAVGMESDFSTFLRFVQSGITGYILKDASATDLADAVLSVARGSAVCPPDLCLGLFHYVAGQGSRNQDFSAQRQRSRLTNREQQLIRQVRSGSTNKEIAAHLNLSEQTVKNHMHNILRKLGAPDRLAAAEIWSSQTCLPGTV